MLKFFLLIHIVLFSVKNIGQNLSSEDFNNIQKNILIYRIKELHNSMNQYRVGNQYLFSLLPNNNEKLLIKSNRIDVDFRNYVFFELKIETFNFYNKFEIPEKISSISINSSGIIDLLSKNYLVAKDKEGKLIFVSGMFYKNCISSLLKLSANNPVSYIKLIDLKLFNYKLKNIKYIKKRKQNIIFKAYSQTLDEEISIILDTENPDEIEVKLKRIALPN